MKIRRKTSFIFTALASLVLFFSFSFIYFLTERYTKSDFYERLQEKADFTALKYFEKDEISQKVYEQIMVKNSLSLPEASEIVLDAQNPRLLRDSLSKFLPSILINNLLSGKRIKFYSAEKQGVGLYYPDNQGTFVIIITAVDKVGIKKQEHLLRILLIIFIGSIIFIYFTGMLFARKVFQPVGHILKNVKRISATNLKLRLTEPSSNDELTELIKLLNEMLDRLEHSFDMQKHFISNASHELKNPLTAIIGETEITLSKKRSVEEYELSLGKIAAEAERLDLLTKNLLSLAQVDFDLSKIVWKPIRVDELLWEVKDYFEKTDNKGRIIVHIESLPENPQFLTIYGNENLLSIALTNIIDNACKFSGDKPVDITFSANGTLIFLSIADKGIGIPAKELNEISEPFFRASNALSFRGSGIGLSLSYKIIKLHRGTIEFNSVHGKGTEVRISFFYDNSRSY